MTYQATSIELSLNRAIAPPCFEAGRDAVRLIASIYKAVSPSFVLALSDIQGLPGSSMADVGIRGSLFAGNLRFEISPPKFNIEARGIKTAADLQVIVKATGLLEAAIREAFPDLSFGSTSVSVVGWLGVTAGTDPIGPVDIIRRARPTEPLKLLDGETISYPARAQIKNSGAGYSADCLLDLSVVPGSSFFFRVAVDVEPSSEFFQTDKLALLTEGLIMRWFQHFEIPLVSDAERQNA